MLGTEGQALKGADAVTVSPYLGDDSLEPFITVACERSAGVFVLVKTSNPGGRMLQDLVVQSDAKGTVPSLLAQNSGQSPLYRHVADYVERQAAATAGTSGYGAVGAVGCEPRIRSNWPSFAGRCRTRCSSSPALAVRVGKPRTWLRRSTPMAAAGGGEQFPRHHLCPCGEALR